MITANLYTHVDFDDEGKEKIKECIETMQTIIDSIGKCSTHGDYYTKSLQDACEQLQGILNDTLY